MEEFISSSVSLFTKFLSESENIIKKNNLPSYLVSFALNYPASNLENKFDFLLKIHERSFYFEKPDENFLIFGMDEALNITENGEKRFSATDKKIKEWKEKFHSNWSEFNGIVFPLFLGSLKFAVEHADNDWSDFNDSTWFVPEVLLYKAKEQRFLLFNFVYSSEFPKGVIINKFRSKLEKLFNNNFQPKEKPVSKILHSSGSSPKDKKKWKNLVVEALEKISEKEVNKIVLSRRVDLLLTEEPDFYTILKRLRKDYGDTYLFISHHGKSSFFGATPERLAKFTDGKVEIDALAGSAPRGKNDSEDLVFENNLLADKKNLNEHNFVIDHILSSITNFTKDFTIVTNTKIRKLANIQHLWTKISAKLNVNSSIMLLLKELFPTPAVCGIPKDMALQLIKKLEGYKRGLYSGTVGWFNFNNEGEFVIGIRSALSLNNKLIAFAGCGIVENSDPELEYQETELKLKTILSLFNETQD